MRMVDCGVSSFSCPETLKNAMLLNYFLLFFFFFFLKNIEMSTTQQIH